MKRILCFDEQCIGFLSDVQRFPAELIPRGALLAGLIRRI